MDVESLYAQCYPRVAVAAHKLACVTDGACAPSDSRVLRLVSYGSEAARRRLLDISMSDPIWWSLHSAEELIDEGLAAAIPAMASDLIRQLSTARN